TAGVALSANPGTTGQPSKTCGTPGATATPGNAANPANPGSAFNPGGKADTVYAGTQPQNSTNPNSVAQYDVACFQNTQIPCPADRDVPGARCTPGLRLTAGPSRLN